MTRLWDPQDRNSYGFNPKYHYLAIGVVSGVYASPFKQEILHNSYHKNTRKTEAFPHTDIMIRAILPQDRTIKINHLTECRYKVFVLLAILLIFTCFYFDDTSI